MRRLRVGDRHHRPAVLPRIRLRRRFAIAAATVCLLLVWHGAIVTVQAQSATNISAYDLLEEQIEAVPTHDLEAFLQTLDADLQQYVPEFDLRRMVLDPEGGIRFDLLEMIGLLLSRLARELVVGSSLLVQLVAVAILAALLHNLATAFGNKGVHELAFLVAMMALLFLGVQTFRTAVHVANTSIDNMVGFMHALLPLMATLLAAVGGVTSAAIFHPMLVALVAGIATLVQNVIFPLAFVGVIVAVIGKIASDFPVDRLAGLARQWSMTMLGLCFIVFMAFLSVRGAIGPVADGLGVRAAKFLTGTFVPVIGSRIADAMEVVVGGSLLIKNAIGAFGMIAVFVITALPAVKLFSLLVIFRVATALVEPVSEKRLIEALNSLGDGLALILACVLTTALMFFIAVTVLITLGNVTVVMR